jgi:ParB family chromosome partitioning protein
MKYYGLGKGLASLLSETTLPSNGENEQIKIIEIDDLESNPNCLRKNFEYDKIKELSDSILSKGLLQPLIVTKKNNKYKIISGERRWRACKLAKLTNIPVIINNINDKETFEISLIDNIQRDNLSIIEIAETLAKLVQEFNYTIEELAHKLSKTYSYVRNILNINKLSSNIKNMINNDTLSIDHIKYFIDHEEAELIANSIIKNQLNLYQTEELVKNWPKDKYSKLEFAIDILPNDQSDDFKIIANNLSEQLNVKVTIENYNDGGKLILHYNDLNQLDLLLSKIN